MKSLFWTKIPDKVIDSTVWGKLSDANIKLDLEFLESAFCKANAKAAGGATMSMNFLLGSHSICYFLMQFSFYFSDEKKGGGAKPKEVRCCCCCCYLVFQVPCFIFCRNIGHVVGSESSAECGNRVGKIPYDSKRYQGNE